MSFVPASEGGKPVYTKSVDGQPSITVPMMSYKSILFFGLLGGTGMVFLMISSASGTSGNLTITNVLTGQAYTSPNISFSRTNGILTITFVNASTGLLISSGYNIGT